MGVKLLESEAYKDVSDFRISPSDETLASDDALDLWLRQTVGTARHVSGTCRMGPASDARAVVNDALRVHGVAGLRVIDASIMPMLPSANTFASTIAIAEKGADLIRGRTAGPEQ